MSHSYITIPQFDEDKDNWSALNKQIERHMNLICQAPYHYSYELVKGKWRDFRGKRSSHMQVGHFIFILAICKDCITRGFEEFNHPYCGDKCDGQPQERVVFMAFNLHDAAYGKR